MSRKSKPAQDGYAKILDAWRAPDHSGDPIGVFATSFSFSSDFFEEKCLDRFLHVEADPDEDDRNFYLFEREEKLGQLQSCTAFVDHRECKGLKSLRWNMLAATIPGGVFHPKVAILQWSHHMRLIVASANLTKSGCCINRETFAVLDYCEGSSTPKAPLIEIAAFLKECLSKYGPKTKGTKKATDRAKAFLDSVPTKLAALKLGDEVVDSVSGPHPIIVDRGRDDTFAQLAKLWPKKSLPTQALVTSPYFDAEHATNAPMLRLWDALAPVGDAGIAINVETEATDEALVIKSPDFRDTIRKGRRAAWVSYLDINRNPSRENDFNRQLHAKSIALFDTRHVLAMIGSSNFTSNGLGLSRRSTNVEVNLAYLFDAPDGSKEYKAVKAFLLEGEPIDLDSPKTLSFAPIPSDDNDETQTSLVAATGFSDAIFTAGPDGKLALIISLDGTPPPGWTISESNDQTVVYTEKDWLAAGKPDSITIPWSDRQPVSGLKITWQGKPGFGWLSVTTDRDDLLPPPGNLGSLPLDVIVQILTSKRPIHQAIRDYLLQIKQEREARGELPFEGKVELDSLRRFDSDSSKYLLQRTRRVSWAYTALKLRLEKPAATLEAMKWRLFGPIGVSNLAEAVAREATGSPDERAFLLAELALELHRVKPSTKEWSIPAEQAKVEIRKAIEIVADLCRAETLNASPRVTAYAHDCLTEVAA